MNVRRERGVADSGPSANEHVQNAGKKTVMPADVFQALEDTEFGFLREPLEAEFASAYQPPSLPSNPPSPPAIYICKAAHPQSSTSRPLPHSPAQQASRSSHKALFEPPTNPGRIQPNPIRQTLHLPPESRSSQARGRDPSRGRRHLRPGGRHAVEEAAGGGRRGGGGGGGCAGP